MVSDDDLEGTGDAIGGGTLEVVTSSSLCRNVIDDETSFVSFLGEEDILLFSTLGDEVFNLVSFLEEEDF